MANIIIDIAKSYQMHLNFNLLSQAVHPTEPAQLSPSRNQICNKNDREVQFNLRIQRLSCPPAFKGRLETL